MSKTFKNKSYVYVYVCIDISNYVRMETCIKKYATGY